MQNKLNSKKKVKIMYGGLNCPNPHNKAYMMLGHASTSREIYKVPDNCVYITTTICGTLANARSQTINDFYSFFKNNREIVKNPCSFTNFNKINQIISKNSEVDKYINNVNTDIEGIDNVNFLNMHISRKTCETSATCPKNYLFEYKNASYDPCSFWFYKNDEQLYELTDRTLREHNTILFHLSGLVSSDNAFNKMESFRTVKKMPWKYPMLTLNMIHSLYKYSVYPSFNDIFHVLSQLDININLYLEITDPRDPSYIDVDSYIEIITGLDSNPLYYNTNLISGFDFIQMIINNFTVNQSELFELFPGVHYNTKCREFSEYYSKPIQRQLSVGNRQNLFDLYAEENNDTNSICKKCSTQATAAAAIAAGVTCCLGSTMGLSSSVTAAAATAAAGIGAYSAPRIEKIKREGGKKKTKQNKKRKNKTRQNKTRRNKKV